MSMAPEIAVGIILQAMETLKVFIKGGKCFLQV